MKNYNVISEDYIIDIEKKVMKLRKRVKYLEKELDERDQFLKDQLEANNKSIDNILSSMLNKKQIVIKHKKYEILFYEHSMVTLLINNDEDLKELEKAIKNSFKDLHNNVDRGDFKPKRYPVIVSIFTDDSGCGGTTVHLNFAYIRDCNKCEIEEVETRMI